MKSKVKIKNGKNSSLTVDIDLEENSYFVHFQ